MLLVTEDRIILICVSLKNYVDVSITSHLKEIRTYSKTSPFLSDSYQKMQ